jgi:hypothetical protein
LALIVVQRRSVGGSFHHFDVVNARCILKPIGAGTNIALGDSLQDDRRNRQIVCCGVYEQTFDLPRTPRTFSNSSTISTSRSALTSSVQLCTRAISLVEWLDADQDDQNDRCRQTGGKEQPPTRREADCGYGPDGLSNRSDRIEIRLVRSRQDGCALM